MSKESADCVWTAEIRECPIISGLLAEGKIITLSASCVGCKKKYAELEEKEDGEMVSHCGWFLEELPEDWNAGQIFMCNFALQKKVRMVKK